MMKFKTNSFLFMMLGATAFSSWAGYYNTIDTDGVSIHFDKDKAGSVSVYDDKLNTDYSCKIENWNDSLLSGAGGISLTSDHVGVLIASGNKYLDVKELIGCKGQSIRIHSIPYFNNAISSIIDVNFEKKLVLALVVIDAHFRSYQAIVSRFNGNKNLLSGKGFWSNSPSIYLGKISVNGEYVAPNDLDCAADSFPGVWDIGKRKKVVLSSDKDSSVVDSECKDLFSGKTTLKELGAKLIYAK